MMWKLSKWIHIGCVRIGEPAVSESVGGEQIAELVMPRGLRHAPHRNQRDADGERAKSDHDTRQASFGVRRREKALCVDKKRDLVICFRRDART